MLKISKAALVAAVLSLSAVPAVGIVGAAAEDTSTSSTGLVTNLTIPSINAVDSSMDEAALRDALSGGFMNHVNELATLNATSITIPQIALTMTVTSDGAPVTTTVSYKDIVLNNVKNGVAESASVGAADTTSAEGSFHFGKMSTSTLDFGAILSLYSLVPAGDAGAPMKVLYKDFNFEGGTFSGPKVNCTFGKVSAAEFQARPLKVSFAAMMEAANKFHAAKADGTAAPDDLLVTMATFFTDVFQAFKSEPLSIDGLSCDGQGDDGPFDFHVDNITMDGYQPGIYPALTFSGLQVVAGPTNVSLASATIKSTDLSAPIKAIEAEGSNLTTQWLDAHPRQLIPAFGGFSMTGLSVQTPNPDKPSEQVSANLGDFDLSLSDYLNGVPTRLSSRINGLDIPVPKDSTDENMQMLTMLGITRVNLGAEVTAHWDRDAQTVSVDTVSLNGQDLGSFALSLMIGNAGEGLFAEDMNTLMTAAQSLTFKAAQIDVVDAGMLDKALPLVASMQGADPDAFRSMMAGQAEAAPLQLLGSTDGARALGRAASDFISGKAKSLTINITSKDPAGVPAAVIMAAADDPTQLPASVDIVGSAQ